MRTKPGSSPLGETSTVPAASRVASIANGRARTKISACASRRSEILDIVVGRGCCRMLRRSD